METVVTHHVDASEPDAHGMAGVGAYRYEYDLYSFTDSGVVLVARAYQGEPEAHFLRIALDGEPRALIPADLHRPILAEAADYLRTLGKTQLRWLGEEGYEPRRSAT
jgi:hypothetical protein